VGPAHVWWALLKDADGIVPRAMARLGYTARELVAEADALLAEEPVWSGPAPAPPPFGTELGEVLERARSEAAQLGDQAVAPEHLFLGLLEGTGPVARALPARNRAPDRARRAVLALRGGQW
jgi:ATP-dependent Clp protease ATP-binding subunit ClpB